MLCAFDWVGIGNSGYDTFREGLARAAGTTPDRVALHALHQHDAPGCDFRADEILTEFGLGNRLFDVGFARIALDRTAAALTESLRQPQVVTEVGYGKARVDMVASNRRIVGDDGKVKAIRWSATKDEAVRAEPEGTIDPFLHLVSFWHEDRPIATLSYYATHPQSHYGLGGVTCDFPGLARNQRDREQPGVAHIHFNGAAGNVTAGKYNDGAPENRPVLTARLAEGMKAAWEATGRMPIQAKDVGWKSVPVSLPPARFLDMAALRQMVANEGANMMQRLRSARQLAWVERCAAGYELDVSCLSLGNVAVLHLPGELFIEYQLAAQAIRPEMPTVMAAYADYGPGYIGLQKSYDQGGYETGEASLVSPEVEGVLMDALRKLLK